MFLLIVFIFLPILFLSRDRMACRHRYFRAMTRWSLHRLVVRGADASKSIYQVWKSTFPPLSRFTHIRCILYGLIETDSLHSCLRTVKESEALEVEVAISVLCGLAPQMPMRRLSEALSMETFVIARSLRVFDVRAKTSGMVRRNQPVAIGFANNVSLRNV